MINTSYIHSVLVQYFASGQACCVNQYHYESQERLVVLRLVHTTSEICLVHDITLFVAVHSYCQVTFQLLSLSLYNCLTTLSLEKCGIYVYVLTVQLPEILNTMLNHFNSLVTKFLYFYSLNTMFIHFYSLNSIFTHFYSWILCSFIFIHWILYSLIVILEYSVHSCLFIEFYIHSFLSLNTVFIHFYSLNNMFWYMK